MNLLGLEVRQIDFIFGFEARAVRVLFEYLLRDCSASVQLLILHRVYFCFLSSSEAKPRWLLSALLATLMKSTRSLPAS